MKIVSLNIVGIGLLSPFLIKAQTQSLPATSKTTTAKEVRNVAVDPPPVTEEPVFEFCEQVPEYSGGESALMQFLSKNIQYPAQVREQNIAGKVIAQFIVEVDGSISHIQILRGLGFGCDEEVIRVLQLMPKWKSGKQNGRPIRAMYR
ncbi:MAG: hypothetical protein RIQ62_1278, partial [Bacteroidota bacterium]